jgi:hypothetical protein
MNASMFGVAILLGLMVLAPWLALLLAPLALAAGVFIRLSVTIGRRLQALELQGILGINGLASEPRLSDRLHAAVGRVLELGPRVTRPKACACVKEVDGSFVGVLRVFNTKGHYLLRVTGETVSSVTRRFLATLGEFGSSFPVRAGAHREECQECSPATCPLRQLPRPAGSTAAA